MEDTALLDVSPNSQLRFPSVSSRKEETLSQTEATSSQSPRKRAFTPMKAPYSPKSMDQNSQSTAPALPCGNSRQPSPAPSTLSSISSLSSHTLQATLAAPGSLSGEPSAKRRKLTVQEKEQKTLEKLVREQEREEKKAKREEEKLLKDEKRRLQNEVREEKKRERELEKQQREVEKQQREDEKRQREEERTKRENAQKRINNFFVRPSVSTMPPGDPSPSQSEDTTRAAEAASRLAPPTPQKSLQADKRPQSDYEKVFLPFSLPSNATCALHNKFRWDEASTSHFEATIGSTVENNTQKSDAQFSTVEPAILHLLDLLPHETGPRGIQQSSVKEILSKLEGSETHLIDLSIESFSDRAKPPLELLGEIAVKYIEFKEDVRPPYVGTYSKIRSLREARQLSRNPYRKVRRDTNYDYDSEAEWEDPGEGEDLDSEGESEAESVDAADDMDGFLDDEDSEQLANRKRIFGNLEPISSGLCWENSNGSYKIATEGAHVDLRAFKLEIIEETHHIPIDPFSTEYWAQKPTTAAIVSSTTTMIDCQSPKAGLMDPPKHPLQARLGGGMNILAPKSKQKSTKANKPIKLIEGSELEEFKKAVEGSDLTKIGLIEVLKKRFPKTSKDAIRDTLGTFAARIGVKDVDKRWVIIEPQRLNPDG